MPPLSRASSGFRPWSERRERRTSLKAGRVVTVSCAEGDVGRVYDGNVPFETTRVDTGELKRPAHRHHVEPGQSGTGAADRHAAE